MSSKILIVDDNKDMRSQITRWLTNQGYSVDEAGTADETFSKIAKSDYRVVLLDLKLISSVNEGFKVLRRIRTEYPDTCVIVMTGYGNAELYKRAIQEGAFDFFDKPLRFNSLQVRIETAVERFDLTREYVYLTEEEKRQHTFKSIVGNSPPMRHVMELVRKYATTEATVLIQGESGTGKELIARAIHFNSPRASKPFIIADCSAVNSNLIESYLFGHEKGAFTGAIARRRGKFERANSGTLFLDEIGELPHEVQMKLLRFLQERTFERVGGEEEIHADVRIIAATKVNLKQAIQNNTFREDLYYRLHIMPIHIAPLRERKEDIPLLVDHFIKIYSRKNLRNINQISPKALTLLMNYDFRGNIRELENIIQHAILLSDNNRIEPEAVIIDPVDQQELINKSTLYQPIKKAVADFERLYILELLKRNNWNVTKSAEEAEIDRSNLTLKMKKYGIKSVR